MTNLVEMKYKLNGNAGAWMKAALQVLKENKLHGGCMDITHFNAAPSEVGITVKLPRTDMLAFRKGMMRATRQLNV